MKVINAPLQILVEPVAMVREGVTFAVTVIVRALLVAVLLV